LSYPIFYVPAGDVLPVFFANYGKTNGESLTMSGLAVTDIEIYKDGSTTQRSSDAGYTLLDTDGIDFDGLTGIHGFSIDTGDNTDSGFYTVGAWFTVVVSAVTVDSQTVSFIAAQFRIMPAEGVAGKPKVDVDTFGGSAGTFSSGRPEVNTTHAAGTAWGSGAITAASIATGAIDADALAADAVAEIADGVWDEATAGHSTAGSTGKALTDAGSAGDPWSTALPGAYGSGTAGKILGDNLNATVSSRASQTSLDTVDDFLDTEIAAIKAKTDNLPADPADASDIAASFTTVNTKLDAIDDFLDTEMAAVLAAVDTEVAAILALLDDARTEPGQGAPPVNPDVVTKVDYLYKWARNKKSNDGSTTNYYADNGTTVDQKQTTSEAAGTVTVGEMTTGA
jgi:hypothetical protein